MALHFKKVDYEYVAIDLHKQQNLTPEYLSISPYGHVPALKIIHANNENSANNEKDENPSFCVLVQSLPICEFLDETTQIGDQNMNLLPKKLELTTKNIGLEFERCQMRAFCELINAQIQPWQNIAALQTMQEMFEWTDKQALSNKTQLAHYQIDKGLQVIESIVSANNSNNSLQKARYCFNDELTLADVFLIPQLFNALVIYKLDMSAYPTCMKIYEHTMQLPTVELTNPFNCIDS
jgi:maleylacetoacetate isomerase